MGYFNYFIKCIIRNIAYKLCKPKVFLVVLLSVVILMCFKNYGYCSIDEVSTVTPNATDGSLTMQFDNTYLNLRAMQENVQRDFINYMYVSYSISPEYTKNFAKAFFDEIASNNSAGLYYYVQKGDSNSGTKYVVNSYFWSNLSFAYAGVYTDGQYTFANCTYMQGSFSVRYINSEGSFFINPITSTKTIPYPFLRVIVPEWRQMFVDFGLVNTEYQHEVLSKLDALIYRSQQENNQIVNKIEEGNQLQQQENQLQQQQNQLQQEQNQLQQEQNDFLKDDNVETDGLEFATDDTTNPTSDGFNTLFNTVYNAFCNTSSEPLTITLPYINETFTIQPNIVSNGMQKAGLGVVVSLINSFYYFTVCLFIYKDIAKIVDNLKSGNITSDCGNVKTEVL